jgi:hypothetical protein
VAADLRGVAGWRESKRKGDVKAALWLVDGIMVQALGFRLQASGFGL